MKQYDTILVECDEDDPESSTYVNSSFHKTLSNVIVLAIEELREIWDKGYVRGCEEYDVKVGVSRSIHALDFHSYLQSKGINI